MDATKRPLRIPPEFSSYAEQHGLFQIYERLLRQLIINQPEDPLAFLINQLEEPEDIDIPRIILCGPPVSGKKTIAKMLSEQLNCIHLTTENLFDLKDGEQHELPQGKKMAEIVKRKLQTANCTNKGWLIEGFPETKQQVAEIQAAGIIPNHFILLDAPDEVLLERAMGKRIDTLTGEVYHTTFDPPEDSNILQRLELDPQSEETVLKKRLREFSRNSPSVLSCFKHMAKVVNADQPKNDVLSECQNFLKSRQRSNAPHTPRIFLTGSIGCGKSSQASLLAKKYKLVDVGCDELVDQALNNDSKEGQAIRPYTDRKVAIPDDMLLQLVVSRLTCLDATINGWILHGFPATRTQAEALSKANHCPNYVITLDVPQDAILERLTLRAVDPVTGQRYHLLYDPPEAANIKDRLQVHPDDEEVEVAAKMSHFEQNIEELLDFYSPVHHIDGDQDTQIVFDCIEGIIVNPNKRSKQNE